MPGTRFSVEIRPVLPKRLKRLEDLANDLYYSWDRGVRRLFRHLDEHTWQACRSNPKVFLRRVSQRKLEDAARDPIFLSDFRSILSAYDTYMQERPLTEINSKFNMRKDLIAYFSAEFGFHQSVPIYAGGLGILAGDYCKSMSNLWVPFVGIGLLYREGYFTQHILSDGSQIATYPHVDPADLPIVPAVDNEGNELNVSVDIAGRPVKLKVWMAKVGHIRIYLLDTDLPENTPEERDITSQLYGGDATARIKQEIVLGIGGVRALRALDLAPSVWHINEGHAGFQLLERCREYVKSGLNFDSAIELVAAKTVFTTHTPVTAGHDIFDIEVMRTHFPGLIPQLGISEPRFMSLGADPDHASGFNMTSLSLRGSRFHNGVSRIHGSVAARMESHIWPDIPPDENPIGYVTNGIDVDTFLGQSWAALFDMYVGRGWRAKLADEDFWKEFVSSIPNHVYQSVKHIHKNAMLDEIKRRVVLQLHRNGHVESEIRETIQHLNPTKNDVLVIGFARRFATYKRATLLFRELDRLAKLLNDPERPVLFIFAGKAHPNDEPGQSYLREIMSIANRPEFRGKILLLEDYNLSLARDLYPGVDVWLNVPEYPKEACGTSGMKAAINGALNLSVLDGWWAEAYNGQNGWAITPHPELDPAVRDSKEATELYNVLEQEVVPLFFSRNEQGEPEPWVEKSKLSMQTIIPRFNGMRMAMDYLSDLYGPAAAQGKKLSADQASGAVALAEWRKKITSAWPKLKAKMAENPLTSVTSGESLPIKVEIDLNGLEPNDIKVECVCGAEDDLGQFIPMDSRMLEPIDDKSGKHTVYQTDLSDPLPCYGFDGLQHFRIRMYPCNELQSHRFECGLMLWV